MHLPDRAHIRVWTNEGLVDLCFRCAVQYALRTQDQEEKPGMEVVLHSMEDYYKCKDCDNYA